MMRAPRLRLTALLSLSLAGGVSPASAQDALTLTHDALVAGGGRMEAAQSLRAITVLGEPIGGGAASETLRFDGGAQSLVVPPLVGTGTVIVEGTVDEPTSTIVVNGVAATRSGLTFRAEGVRLREGPNSITVIATDLAGNRTEGAITVWLTTRPPARPTVEAPPAVTTDPTVALSGTKTKGTSIWINGVEVVLFNDLTAWSAVMPLVEGDNVFSIVTQDAVDHRSTAATTTIVVDRLPPVITVTAPALTNLTPLLLSGLVDDHLTRVEARLEARVIVAARSGRSFEAAVPLTEGPNALTIVATSPNGHVATKPLPVTLGTIPTITSLQPADGSLLDAEAPLTLTAAATDKEGNPVEYQLWLDDQLVVDWAAQAAYVWTPDPAREGVHAIEARARDAFGGFASQRAETFVARKPIIPSP